jgi:hypothetical protein
MTAPVHAWGDEFYGGTHADCTDEHTVRRERCLLSTIVQLDEVVGGFRSSATTLLDSDSRFSSELLHLLCVRSFAELGEEIVWIDGGNTVDPYILSAMCKRMGLDRHEMLSMVSIARAFTAHQLVTMIEDVLGREVRRSSPSTVIVSSIADMFMDKDMRRSEACQLLRGCAQEVARTTGDNDTVTIVTSHTPGRVEPERRMMAALHGSADVVVRLRGCEGGSAVRAHAAGRSAVFAPVPWNQRVLDDFTGGCNGEDRSHLPPRA